MTEKICPSCGKKMIGEKSKDYNPRKDLNRTLEEFNCECGYYLLECISSESASPTISTLKKSEEKKVEPKSKVIKPVKDTIGIPKESKLIINPMKQ